MAKDVTKRERVPEYRCFEVKYVTTEMPNTEAINKMFAGWMDRKGDPCYVAEVFKINDKYTVSALIWVSAQTTVNVVARCLAKKAIIEGIPHVDYRDQLSARMCRDKSRRVLAVRAGF